MGYIIVGIVLLFFIASFLTCIEMTELMNKEVKK